MSNDHIFAAQMWSWADPMIKRDSHGRILIVNAAFLQLYGGTVETWTGNPIEGWPTPKSPGEMSRFESRIPLPTGGETVYDWMECTNHDGTALAMARDVTAYTAKPATQTAPMMAQPVQQSPEPIAEPNPVQSAPVQQELASLSPVFNAPENPTQQAPVQQAPVQQAPVQPAPQTDNLATNTTQHQMASDQQMPASVPAQPVEPPAPSPAQAAPMPTNDLQTPEPVQQVVQTAPIAPVAEQSHVQLNPLTEAREENRAMEKRALPIENGDAILGNNWRDAVIAKAVGVEDAADEKFENESSNDEAPVTLSNAEGDQVKVLLAEDNAINALLTRTLLEAEGCLCDVVEDGALAVEAVKNNEYHMVFMDMRMPNMDGLEATRKIRSLGYNAKILPIVALTANAFDDDRNACFDSGMNDFMTKPVSAEELSAMVRTHTALEAEKLAS